MIQERLSAEQAAMLCQPYTREGHAFRATCPVCSGNDCTFSDGERGLLAYCWHGCESINVLRALRFNTAIAMPIGQRPNSTFPESNLPYDIVNRIWNEATALASDDPATRYLQSRGLIGLPRIDALRFHPSLITPKAVRSAGGPHRAPAMVARFDAPGNGMIAVHRIWLQLDGSGQAAFDSPKRILGNGLSGGAIRLFESGPRLGIAEGIETALACYLASDIPTWSVYSASIMASVVIPPTVREVIVFADHDPAGIRSAEALADRLTEEGFQVKLLIPSTPGNDWLDEILVGKSHGRA